MADDGDSDFEGVAKEDMDSDGVGEESEVRYAFDAATTYVAASTGSYSDATKLKFYGLFKQATVGPCDVPKPGMLDFKGKAKWSAWNELKDMDTGDAMEGYLNLLTEESPEWLSSANQGKRNEKKGGGGGPGGPVFSMMGELEGDQEDAARGSGSADGPVEEDGMIAGGRTGDVKGVEVLLGSGSDVNTKDEDGRTPLHWAADGGHLDMVKLLVSKGAVLDAQDSEGQTALHYGVTCEYEEVCKALVGSGADRGVADAGGETPQQLRPLGWASWWP